MVFPLGYLIIIFNLTCLEANFCPSNLALPQSATAAAKSLQSCPTLCDPIGGSPPDSPVPGILQARILEWVAIYFCNTRKENWKWIHSVISNYKRPQGLHPTRLLRPWDFPGKSTGVGCHFLLPAPVWPSAIKDNSSLLTQTKNLEVLFKIYFLFSMF